MRNIFPNVKGAAKAIAQGQATIKTAVNTLNAFEGSTTSQNKVETKAILNTATVNRLLMLSVNDWKIPVLSLLNTSLLQSWVK